MQESAAAQQPKLLFIIMEAKEVLSHAHAALIQCDYKRAIGYYEQLLAGIKDEMSQQQNHPSGYKRRRKGTAQQLKRDLLLGYANAMAHCENADDLSVASALQVYRQLLLNEMVVDGRIMERLLRNATSALVGRVQGQRQRRKGRKLSSSSSSFFTCTAKRLQEPRSVFGDKRLLGHQVGSELLDSTAGHNDLEIRAAPAVATEQGDRHLVMDTFDVDPLLCGVCDDLLKQPVTVQCGHTFCRQCAMSLRECSRCPVDQAAPIVIMAVGHVQEQQQQQQQSQQVEGVQMEKDVLISRLVDKWWGAELKAESRNENARLYLEAGQLDQALRSANESLEQGE